MQRLRGSDAFAIYSDTPTSPFVTMKVAIYQPTDRNNPPTPGELKQFFLANFANIGLQRTGLRIVRVPFDLHHPVWVADPAFSPEDHIYHVGLPAPGGKAELCEFLSELAGIPLNYNRPLWELWLVEGLEDGKIAAVIKIHHSLADGKMVASLIQKTHTVKLTTTGQNIHIAGESVPGKLRLIAGALVDLVKSYTVELPHYYRHLKQAREGSAAIEMVEGETVAPFSAPWTIFNQLGGPYRTYRYETFSLSEFKIIEKHFDCTVNTMVLGVISEAARRYLKETGNLPSASLVCAMPVGDQAGANPETMLHSDIHNNNLAVSIVPLYQNIEDMGERLKAIRQASKLALNVVRRSNGRRVDNFLDFLPGTMVRLFNAISDRRSKQHLNPHANLIISNVPGPREALYALDGRLEMVDLLSTGNLADAGSINITVWSYVDNLNFSFYFRKGVLPNPESMLRHTRDVVEELRSQYLTPVPASRDEPAAAGQTTG